MKKINRFFLFCAFVSLMVLRLFIPIKWFSSLALAGIFISVLDIITQIWKNNPISQIKNNVVFLGFLAIGILIEVVLIVLSIVNIVMVCNWMQDPLFTDEIAIAALLLGAFQPTIVSYIGYKIRKEK